MAQNIESKAEAYCRSYAEAVNLLARDKATSTTNLAEAIFSHYMQPGFTVFSLGQRTTMDDGNTTLPGVKSYLDRWVELGLGLDLRMNKYRVEVVSDLPQQGGGLALCRITWSIHPPAGSEWHGKGWDWDNVYAFRVPPGQDDGYFEFVVSDNEIAALLQRCPNFMDGLS